MGFFDKIKNGLKKTRESISGQIIPVCSARLQTIDEELFEELEELLVHGRRGRALRPERICDAAPSACEEGGR